MMPIPDETLHRIFNEVVADPAVPAHRLVFEAMNRAYRYGQDCYEEFGDLRDDGNFVPYMASIERALYDFKLPAFVRSYIAIKSLNATCTFAIEDAGHMPTLYGVFRGRPVRVTLVSRLGDVGVSYTDRLHGYDERCSIYDVTDFRADKPEGF
jgi:hypothetical protein